MLQYIIDERLDKNYILKIKNKLPEVIYSIYALRGNLAFDVLQHCLTLRVGVDFGAPEKHHKRVGVPYEAAEVPSLRAEYAQPDLAIPVSLISYYSKGLTYEQFI